MLIWNPSKLTTKGKALLAKAQAGRCTIKITKAQTGSGQYSSGEATDTRTSLKAPVQTLPIHSKEIQNGSTLVLKVAITNKTSDTDVLKSGYEIREFGIFAQDPDDGEILYSIATASTSDYMPAYNGVIPSVISMSYYLEVANASSVTIVTAGGLALQSDLEALADRVTIIEQAAVKKYGARKKVGQQSCILHPGDPVQKRLLRPVRRVGKHGVVEVHQQKTDAVLTKKRRADLRDGLENEVR